MKDLSYKGPYSVSSSLHEVSGIDRSVEMGSEFVVAQGWGQVEDGGGWLRERDLFLLLGVIQVFTSSWSWGQIHGSANVLRGIEPCTSNGGVSTICELYLNKAVK